MPKSTSAYSFRNIFKQEPNAIREAVLIALNTMSLAGWAPWSTKAALAISTIFGAFLTMLYVRPFSSSNDALNKLKEHEEVAFLAGAGAQKARNRTRRK